jgi:hypothetical protein
MDQLPFKAMPSITTTPSAPSPNAKPVVDSGVDAAAMTPGETDAAVSAEVEVMAGDAPAVAGITHCPP